jgi:hypothetical protein
VLCNFYLEVYSWLGGCCKVGVVEYRREGVGVSVLFEGVVGIGLVRRNDFMCAGYGTTKVRRD